MAIRDELKPHNKKRLAFEGVLIDVYQPSAKNGYKYGLVFASVYAPHEDIELDHVVIEASNQTYKTARLRLNKRYTFTAKITSYSKYANVQGTHVQRRDYMLSDINPYKLRRITESKMVQPTRFVSRRISKATTNILTPIKYTEDELYETIMKLPNDGSIEGFIDSLRMDTRTKTITKRQLIQSLYF